MDLMELRKVSMEFRRLSSNALRAKYDDGNLHLMRLRHYIEKNQYIQGIINDEIAGADIDYKTEFIVTDGGWNYFNYPVCHSNHMKAILDYFYEITEKEIDIRGEARKYTCQSKKWDDIVRNFVEKLIKPFIDFVTDRISMDIMSKEQSNSSGLSINQFIDKNYGTANIASGNITSTNKYNFNEIEKINELISTLKTLIEESNFEDEIMEEYLDDLDTVAINVNLPEPKIVKLKKAVKGIGAFIKSIPATLNTSQLIVKNSEELMQTVDQFMKSFT